MGGGGVGGCHWGDLWDRLVAGMGDGSLLGPCRPPVPLPLGCSASMSRVMQTFPITSSRLEDRSQEQDMVWDRSLPAPVGPRRDSPCRAFRWGKMVPGYPGLGPPRRVCPHGVRQPPFAASWKTTSGNNFTLLCPKAQASMARCGFSGVYNGVEHAGRQSHQPLSPHAEPPPPRSRPART